jgi:hypothetical protein
MTRARTLVFDHQAEVEGPIDLVHAKLPQLGAKWHVARVCPEEVGGEQHFAGLVKEEQLVEERLASEGVVFVRHERHLNLR